MCVFLQNACIFNAFGELGKKNIDYNGETQNGIGEVQLSLDSNRRHSADRAFLEPVRSRPNLNIRVNSFVTKILIDSDSKNAYGVRYVKNQQTFNAYASKEVILSAGSINTPQILMWSGIGPKNHLIENDINVVQDLPVGERLQDHLMYALTIFR